MAVSVKSIAAIFLAIIAGGAALLLGHPFAENRSTIDAPSMSVAAPFDAANARYSFMGDTFSLSNGAADIEGHSGLAGAPQNTLVPMGYTLEGAAAGDLQRAGAPDDEVVLLQRGFGANLEWLALFGFSGANGSWEQIASSTVYTKDAKVESLTVGPQGQVVLNLLVVSAADQQNLPHYKQVPSVPLALTFQLIGNQFIPVSPQTKHGLSEYTDSQYGFSFWYPSALTVESSAIHDANEFPGGVARELIEVGPPGAVSVYVVDSPDGSITDEPNHHASPISQTKYFYDVSQGAWMVAYPEGSMTGKGGATTTADVSDMTMSGLPMLPSGRRFDTTIIPLSRTRFLVVLDGGGSTFTKELAATVALLGAAPSIRAQSAALQAEQAAYGRANGVSQ